MKISILFALLSFTSSFAQTIDYNTKKGFAANGYDVVAYFGHEAKSGNKAFVFKYDGVNYKFSSKKNLISFKNNPEKYIPQYGGYCAFAIAKKSSKVSINPKVFQIIDDKLYLFYSAWGTNTLALWNEENEKTLQKKADKNWELIKHKK